MSIHSDFKYLYEDKPYRTVDTQTDFEALFTCKQESYEPAADETLFIITRHGENQSNVNNTYDGRTLNLPITLKGREQAQKAGVKLSGKITHIDHVITNSMSRTHDTAKEILMAFPESQPEFTQDERFLERNSGKYEGGPLTALVPNNKEDKRISASRDHSFEEKMKFSPEPDEIETYASVWARNFECIQETSSKLKGKVVLVVTHSGDMRADLWHLLHAAGGFVSYGNSKPGNCASIIASVKNGVITMHETLGITITPTAS